MNVLLVEDNPADARLVLEALKEPVGAVIHSQVAERLSSAKEDLEHGQFDAVLLDLSLPDSQGLQTLYGIKESDDSCPIIVLTGLADDEFALEIVRAGAGDYLIKGKFDADLLQRSIRHAIERGKAEDQLRLQSHALAAIDEAMLIIDQRGLITWANPAYENLSGYRLDEVIGSTADSHFMNSMDPENWTDCWDTVWAGTTWRRELMGRRKDGSIFNEEMAVTPVRSRTGQVNRFIATMHDISARKEAEEHLRTLNQLLEKRVRERTATLASTNQALLAAKEEAEKANSAKSDFLSRVSHELRTPLNAILGFAQLLDMRSPTGYQREAIGQIIKGGQHLLSLVDQLLELSAIEAGTFPLVLEVQPIQAAIDEVVDVLSPLADAANVQVVHEFGEELYVRADRQRFQQVLMNLISNAIKYNRPQGEVRIRAIAEPATIRVEVMDNGVGIAAEDESRLFLPFSRLGPKAGDVQGVGLGLSICRSLVNAMQGLIEYSSRAPDRGSVFTVTLQRVFEDSNHERLEGEAPCAVTFSGPCKVLLIEDNLSNVSLIESLIGERASATLLVAMQGRLGLDLAREHRPDVVLLDLHLPDLSGFEVLAELRKCPETANSPVIVISADAMEKHVQACMELGAFAFLTKPFRLLEFVETLDAALRAADP
jgi:PAS domain S-box-containing protein